MVDQLSKIKSQFENKLALCKEFNDFIQLKSEFLGKQGLLSTVLKGLKEKSNEEKKIIGKESNELKDFIQTQIANKITEYETQKINEKLNSEFTDFGLKSSHFDHSMNFGGIHPVSIVQNEIEDIFLTLGFDIFDGPHVEDDYHNFEALNIPDDHPARDMQDTFWFGDLKHLLRTHTSTIQVRAMNSLRPPFKFIAPGKVFRCERTDAGHESVFHQIEGMLIDKNVSVSNLIYFMKLLLSKIFKKDVEVRLRPGFFPFVEPGFELDIKCLICQGKGCSVCKQVGWLELLPCGMVHPNVLKHGNIDPETYNGFAFGLGLDRLVMMRYKIDDIRHLHASDLRFLSQFKSF